MKNEGMVLIAIFLMVSHAHSLYAQGPDTLWTRTYGGLDDDQAYSVQQTYDGGYIIAGYTKSFGAGNADVYLVRTDSIGDTLWTRTYGDTFFDAAYSVQQISDSGFIVAGTKQTSTYPNIYGYLIRTDKNGDSLWAKTYGWNPFEVARFYSVDITSDGGYIATGFMYVYKNGGSFQAESNDWHPYEEGRFSEKSSRGDLILLVKTDTDGNVDWHKEYSENLGYCAYSVIQTIDGGYVIAGVAGITGHIISLIKTNDIGDTSWTKQYIDAAEGFSIQECSNGGYIVASNKSGDAFLLMTDSLGDSIWAQTYGGLAGDAGFCVDITLEDQYILTGYTRSFGSGLDDVYLLKVDENGDTVWTRVYGWAEADVGYCGQQTSDSGYIVAGYTRSFGTGDWDMLLLKTQPDVGIEEKEENRDTRHKNKDMLFFAQPNPFTTTTVITLSGIPQNTQFIELSIFDLTGRMIRRFILHPSSFILQTKLDWDGEDCNGFKVPGGIYLVKLQVGGRISTHKVVLMR